MQVTFNSKRIPGSVVVMNGAEDLGIIAKISEDSGDFKKGHRRFVPINDVLLEKSVFINAPTYGEVKEQLIELLK